MTAPTIAILDNDPAILSLIHALLTDEGFASLLRHPSEGADAQALLRQTQPNLVLLDLWLEERDDGWALLEQLWGDMDTALIPVIIVTGESVLSPEHADRLRAMRCPVVRKPFELQDLLTTVATALGPSPPTRAQSDGVPVVPAPDCAGTEALDHRIVAAR